MTAPSTPAPTPAAPVDPGTPPAADPKPADPKPSTDPAPAAQEVSDLPDWAQKIITDAREQAAGERVKAKTAAESAQKELSDKLAEALGLKQADDPAKLLEQANAEKARTTEQLVTLQREIAARDAATGSGANPALLLDSSTFRTELAKLDPTDATFKANLERLVKTTVEAQPHLKAQARAAGASGVDLSGGSGEPTQITDPAVIQAMTAEQRVEALNKGQLRQYMAS